MYLSFPLSIVFQLILNEKAKNAQIDTDSLTADKVDEVVKVFLEDLKEDLLEIKGWPINFSAYIVSKAALNGYTRILAKKFPNIATNAVCPGYVKTDLNHNCGMLSVEEGAKGPVRLVLFPKVGPLACSMIRWKYQLFECKACNTV